MSGKPDWKDAPEGWYDRALQAYEQGKRDALDGRSAIAPDWADSETAIMYYQGGYAVGRKPLEQRPDTAGE